VDARHGAQQQRQCGRWTQCDSAASLTPVVADIVERRLASPTVISPTVVQPVRRITPVKPISPLPAPTVATGFQCYTLSGLFVTTTPAEDLMVTRVGSLQPSPPVGSAIRGINLATVPC